MRAMCRSTGLNSNCSDAPCFLLSHIWSSGSARKHKTTRNGAEPSLTIRVPPGIMEFLRCPGTVTFKVVGVM
eukprot:9404930-Lingulodinium_polyedra.AAC.1